MTRIFFYLVMRDKTVFGVKITLAPVITVLSEGGVSTYNAVITILYLPLHY